MNIETAIFKGVNRGDVKGWQARTRVKITDARELEITTWKGCNGSLDTRAAVYTLDGIFRSHKFSFGAGGGDFSRRLYAAKERCTEANVRAQHMQAINQIDELVAAAANYYAQGRDAFN